MQLHRHLHLRGLGLASVEFRAHGRSSTKRPNKVENRPEHAARLKRDLEDTLAAFADIAAEQKKNRVALTKRGMTVAIEGRPDNNLIVGQARSDTRSLKLLNFRKAQRTSGLNIDLDWDPFDESDDAVLTNEMGDQATYFLTAGAFKSLFRNLGQYAEWVDDESAQDWNLESVDEEGDDATRPRNFWLFESAASIRPATLHDLWTDEIDRLPRKKKQAEWEIWTRRNFQDSFTAAMRALELTERGRRTEFVETVVRNVVGTPDQILQLVQSSAAVVELRGASAFLSDYLEMPAEQQQATAGRVARRIVAPPHGSPRVTLLDTGVNHLNPFLSPSLGAARCYTVREGWKTGDHTGHGTKMAGVAQFGDLSNVVDNIGRIHLTTSLESVVVTAPKGHAPLPARDALQRAVNIVEKDPHPRVFCLAQTAEGETENGQPSSTAAALDLLAYGDGDNTRLFCAAVGNVPRSETEPYQVAEYDDRNARFGIQSPAQGLNALSVGAVALKRRNGQQLVAPVGDLSPTSRTAQCWRRPHPNKPDIVMEGGNFLREPGGVFSQPSLDHFVLTTSRDAPDSLLALTGETSAATAAAAGLAARLLANYPQFRMETIRGMLVHSADWTQAMFDHLGIARDSKLTETEAAALLACYGWGVPNEERLFSSAANALTMIIEDDLSPYELVEKKNIRLKEMKFFKLPWPSDILRSLNQTEVTMRCTLSYFVEPDPHAISRSRPERYASHRLKFDVKRFDEKDETAQHRFNSLVPTHGAGRPDEGWTVGSKLAHRGTLHHDLWKGPAYRLAERDAISIAPVRGWWGDMRQTGDYERSVRYSLIVSIQAPPDMGDLFAEALVNAPQGLLVENPALVDV